MGFLARLHAVYEARLAMTEQNYADPGQAQPVVLLDLVQQQLRTDALVIRSLWTRVLELEARVKALEAPPPVP